MRAFLRRCAAVGALTLSPVLIACGSATPTVGAGVPSAVSTAGPTTSAPSTSGTTQSSAPAPTQASAQSDACATPNSVVTRQDPVGGPPAPRDRVEGLGPFAGHWYVHGAGMDLLPDGTGTQIDYGQPVQTDSLHWTRYVRPDRLLLVVTGVSYTSDDGPVPAPSDACSLADGASAVGDRSLLRVVAPHLLREQILLSHVAPVDVENGNPYWCVKGIAAGLQARCGA